MRVDFKDMGERRTYINHFITRNTNLEKKCQFCGKKAERNPPHVCRNKDCRFCAFS